MLDLREYSDQELSMHVQNDEYLYNTFNHAVRCNNFELVKNVVCETFIYTHEQLEDLENDFNDEVEAYNKENEDDE